MQHVDVRLEDDLTGGPADETVEFGIDGRSYEIDLNARHAADFRRQLARFLEHASLVRPAHRRPPVRTLANRERSRQIRAWAGHDGPVWSVAVSPNGRVALSGGQDRMIRLWDVETGESTVSFKERTDVTAVPAMGVVAETMTALVLADEALRKFGGDSLEEFRRNRDGYLAELGETPSASGQPATDG